MDNSRIEKDLIYRGVKALKEYGYPGVDAFNIMSDPFYKAFFESMLYDITDNPQLGDAAKKLIAEIQRP